MLGPKTLLRVGRLNIKNSAPISVVSGPARNKVSKFEIYSLGIFWITLANVYPWYILTNIKNYKKVQPRD